ncbi:MAG: phosphotransferase family protein [Parvibaculaceae bacterium]|nr:phosphotransferase family protein [Parvibaculaceae bacterium]
MADWDDVIDLTKLSGWLAEQGFGNAPIEGASLLVGGTQNFLLRFQHNDRDVVLRRPPRHLRANSNETMRREARVLAAIADTNVPHAKLIAACGDEAVIGAAFYLMEPVDGFNPTTGLPEFHASDPKVRHRMGMALVEGIAALGQVDYRKVGLEGFGKPDGFLERQVGRWQSQLDSYAAFEAWPGAAGLPGVDRVAKWLNDQVPVTFQPGILHGDYHLANVMYQPHTPELAAIVDWELSTIGDPLLDLGWLMATWPDPNGAGLGAVGTTPWEGFPRIEEMISHYAERSARNLDAISWYGVLACFKLGIILEGTYARACVGKAPKDIGDQLHATTIGLFKRAQTLMA